MNRTSLLKDIKSDLAERGYRCAPGTNFGATALLFRRPDPRRPLLVMIAIQFSRVFDDTFTAYLCVSRTLRWAYQPNDCPSDMSMLLADLLTHDERSLLLDDELWASNPSLRGWWRGFRRTNVSRMIEAVDAAEPRLLARERLLQQIEKSPTLEEWSTLRRRLFGLVDRQHAGLPAAQAVAGSIEFGMPTDIVRPADDSQRRYGGLRQDLVSGGWVAAAERMAKDADSARENHGAFVRSLAQESWTLHQSGLDLREM